MPLGALLATVLLLLARRVVDLVRSRCVGCEEETDKLTYVAVVWVVRGDGQTYGYDYDHGYYY